MKIIDKVLSHFGYYKKDEIRLEYKAKYLYLYLSALDVIEVCYGTDGSWKGEVNLGKRGILQSASRLYGALEIIDGID